MRKYAIRGALAVLFACLPLLTLHALEVSVETAGAPELTPLEAGIERSVYTRIIAGGLNVADYSRLAVSLVQLGELLTLDAVLEDEPPRGFHKDLQGIDELSQAIDEMVASIFAPAHGHPAIAPPPAVAAPPGAGLPVPVSQIELPLSARSLVVWGGEIFLADRDTVYHLEDGQALPWWEAPRRDEIYRLYPYDNSIFVLTRHKDRLHTYRIRAGHTVADWAYAVLPQGAGLISSGLWIAPDITGQESRWSAPAVVEGTPNELPAGMDPLAAVVHDVLPAFEGREYIFFSPQNRLSIGNEKSTIWSSKEKFDNLPFYVEEEYMRKGETQGKTRFETKQLTARYYLPPRILVTPQGAIITIRNDQGLSRILSNVSIYESSEVIAYRIAGDEIAPQILGNVSLGYCTDIALMDDALIMLTAQKGKSKVQVIRY